MRRRRVGCLSTSIDARCHSSRVCEKASCSYRLTVKNPRITFELSYIVHQTFIEVYDDKLVRRDIIGLSHISAPKTVLG
jgi:hypothetical protein